MKKVLVLMAIWLIAIFLAGFYGIIHDQITYLISPEYYTKFKFYQFALVEKGQELKGNTLIIAVSVVGFLATWWVGAIIGLILGLTGLIHQNAKTMFRVSLKALLIVLFIILTFELLGFVSGHLFFSKQSLSYFKGWYIPDNLVDLKKFIIVGTIHICGYIGGFLGLVEGIIFIIKQKRKSIIKD